MMSTRGGTNDAGQASQSDDRRDEPELANGGHPASNGPGNDDKQPEVVDSTAGHKGKKRAISEDGQGSGSGGEKVLKKSESTDPAAAHKQLILDYVVEGLNPLDFIDDPHFRAMLRGFAEDNTLVLPDRGAISALVGEKVATAKIRLKDMVRGEAVSLTCRSWMPGGETTMMAVTAHWVDADWELQSACLAVVKVSTSDPPPAIYEESEHFPMTEKLASALARVLTEFSIEQQNVAAVTTEAEATGREVIDKLTSTPWLPCICYMMDHVMGVMMTDIAQLRTMVDRITTETRDTKKVKHRFVQAQKTHNVAVRTLPKHCATCWKSTMSSAEAFTTIRRPIEAMWERMELDLYSTMADIPKLGAGDWKVLEDIQAIATPWRELQAELEGAEDVPISTLGLVVDSAFDVLTRACVGRGLCPKVREIAQKMKEKMCIMLFGFVRDDTGPSNAFVKHRLRVPRMAAVLDPRMKNVDWASAEHAEEFYFGPVESLLRIIINAREFALRGQAEAGQGSGADGQGPPETADNEGERGAGIAALLTRAKETGRLVKEEGKVGKSPIAGSVGRSEVAGNIMKEWALYKLEDQVECTHVRKLGGPRKWWARKETAYPTVAKLARKYLAVQGSSVALERMFSVDRTAIAEKRGQMDGEKAADIIFLHENMTNKRLW